MEMTLYASMVYRDVDAAVEWIEKVFGGRRRELHRNEDGQVVHAELDMGDSILMLSTAGIGREPFKSLPAGARHLYLAVDDSEKLFERAKAAGAEVEIPLSTTDYGSRDFTLRDPEGNLWAVGTYRPA